MYSHVIVGTDDPEKAKAFYDAVMGVLGFPPAALNEGRGIYMNEEGAFGFTSPINGEPASYANGGTIGFNASSTEEIDAWFAAGMANGGAECEDPPGIRDTQHGKLYLAYLRDPSGNKLCTILRLG